MSMSFGFSLTSFFFAKQKREKLNNLQSAREEGENEPYYSFVALLSENLSANGRTDGNSKIFI
jgi:hypothetical protein